MSLSPEEDLVAVGKLGRTWGTEGMLVLYPMTDFPEKLMKTRRLHITRDDEYLGRLEVLSAKPYKSNFLIKFEGISEIEAAKELTGCLICISEKEINQLGEDEYYWFDLIGCQVLLPDDSLLGVVDDGQNYGSCDILVVKQDEKEYLIPFISEVIKLVDIENRVIRVDPLEGMLDL